MDKSFIQITMILATMISLYIVWQFNFTRSGYVRLFTGSLRDMGRHGYYWSSTAYPDVNNAYALDSISAGTYPSYYTARWDGCSTRCLSLLFYP